MTLFSKEVPAEKDLGREESQARVALESGWHVPDTIELHEGDLVWVPKGRGPSHWVNPADRSKLLEGFIRLSSSTDEEIVKYARQFGVLGICQHGLPAAHNPPLRRVPDCMPDYDYDAPLSCEPQQKRIKKADRQSKGLVHFKDKALVYYEPINVWRQFSKHAHAIVKLVVNLKQERTGDKEDWRVIGYRDPKSPETNVNERLFDNSGKPEDAKNIDTLPLIGYRDPDSEEIRLDTGRQLISKAVNRWLDWFGARPRLSWWDKAEFTLANDQPETGLPAALALHLLMWTTGSWRIGFCASCGDFFLLRPGQDAENNCYCDSSHCGKKAGWRLASGRYKRQEQENPDRDKRQRAKLKESQVKAVRRKGKLSTQECKMFADKFGVSLSTIRKVARGATWKQIKTVKGLRLPLARQDRC